MGSGQHDRFNTCEGAEVGTLVVPGGERAGELEIELLAALL